MATTQLQDIFAGPQTLSTFEDRLFQRCLFFRTGVVRPIVPTEGRADPLSFVYRGCATTLPYWDFICAAQCDSVPASDQEDDACNPAKIGSVADVILKHNRAKAWKASNLIEGCTGSDPLRDWADASALYWEGQYKAILAQQLKGFALTQAQLPSEMQDLILTVGPESDIHENLSLLLADMVSSEGLACSPCMVVLNKRAFTDLKTQEMITSVMNQDTQCLEFFWCGLPVTIMEQLTDPAAGGSFAFILCRDAIIWSSDPNPAKQRIVFDVDNCAGGGAGTTLLVHRDRFVFHLRGISWKGDCSCVSPSNAELIDPDNWCKAYDAKRIPWRGLFIECPTAPMVP